MYYMPWNFERQSGGLQIALGDKGVWCMMYGVFVEPSHAAPQALLSSHPL